MTEMTEEVELSRIGLRCPSGFSGDGGSGTLLGEMGGLGAFLLGGDKSRAGWDRVGLAVLTVGVFSSPFPPKAVFKGDGCALDSAVLSALDLAFVAASFMALRP